MQQVIAGASWSGGKDSCYAVMRAIKNGAQIMVLLNVLNEQGKISRSHGIPYALLEAQAQAMNTPLLAIASTWQNYEENFTGALAKIKLEYDINSMVFGDIDLQAHRDWEEKVCNTAGLQALLPIWKEDRKELVLEMLQSGIETIIVSCNTVMGENFLGKTLNAELITELENIGVDVCGENGEFHTMVIDCPMFNTRIQVPSFTKIQHENYWFLVWDEL